MDVGASAWLVILLAVVAANMPFLTEKLFALIPVSRKLFVVRLGELAVYYVIVGVVGMLLESRIGTGFPQTWEFYWIAGFVFLVLAFPGFVVRYLRKRH